MGSFDNFSVKDLTWQFLVSHIFFRWAWSDKQSPNRLGKAMGMTVPHFRWYDYDGRSESLGKSSMGDQDFYVLIIIFFIPPNGELTHLCSIFRKKFLINFAEKNEGRRLCLFLWILGPLWCVREKFLAISSEQQKLSMTPCMISPSGFSRVGGGGLRDKCLVSQKPGKLNVCLSLVINCDKMILLLSNSEDDQTPS